MGDRKSLEKTLAQIKKTYGEGSVMWMAGEHPIKKIEVVPTGSLALDIALGAGGFPKGRIIEIFGNEACGKCLTADTYVWTDAGLETISELFDRAGEPATCTSRTTDVSGKNIQMVNENGALENISVITHNNRRSVFSVKLRSGRTITATQNHPLRVIDSSGFIVWRKVGDIKKGDMVVSALFGATESKTDENISLDEALLLGHLIAEGHIAGKNTLRFSKQDPQITAEFTSLMENLFGAEVHHYHGKEHAVYSKKIRTEVYDRYGLDYVTSHYKSVPHCVRTGGINVQAAFLSALFDGDGCMEKCSSVSYSSSSKVLAHEIQLLLYGFGISATIAPKYAKGYDHTYWVLLVNPASTHRFLERIGFRSDRRAKQVEDNFRRSTYDPRSENIPNIYGLVRALRDDCGGDREFGDIAGDLIIQKTNLECSKQRLAKIIDWAYNIGRPLPQTSISIISYLTHLLDSEYTYEEVVDVTSAGQQPTFDVVVPETHSFIANGILSHNTSLCLHSVAEAQKRGMTAAYIDTEHSLDAEYSKTLGVNLENMLICQPSSGEEALEIAEQLIRGGDIGIVIIDSVAALVSRAELAGEIGDAHVGQQARLMSQACRILSGAIAKSNTMVVFTNQLRSAIGGGGFGPRSVTSGGRALKYYTSVRVKMFNHGKIEDGDNRIGGHITAEIVKNKIASPYKKAELDIIYGKGIVRSNDLINSGKSTGVITQSGSWLAFGEENIGQGVNKAAKAIEEDGELANKIEDAIREKAGLPPRFIANTEEDEVKED